MKVLYVINTGQMGGLQMHVKCLMESLAGVVETAVAINTEIDPKAVSLFEDAGFKVYRLKGKSGHDWRVVGRFKKILEDFQPDVIHAHGLPFFVAIWFLWKKLFCSQSPTTNHQSPIIHSLHTPPRKPRRLKRIEWFVLERVVDYWLPVSTSTWNEFKKWHPRAKGEVFFNPIKIGVEKRCRCRADGQPFVVGMVGRNADQKDWPSFHRVEEVVKEWFSRSESNPSAVHLLPPPTPIFLNAGEKEVCNGREAISQMDVFVMTSKHEQLPTVVLECFMLGTPICGFIPVGGTTDILGFSKGPVRDAFIAERDCEKLAGIVLDLMQHPEKRVAMIEDGRQILNHFDAEKNCRGQLMRIYERYGNT